MSGFALRHVDNNEIKQAYPTGKCGKQTIEASQIVKVFSKNAMVRDQEAMLEQIETGILALARHTRLYNKESTQAILTVLREINLTADDVQLTIDNVRNR